MSMDDRTDAQKKADVALREAIEATAYAYGVPRDSVITQFVVCGASVRMDDDGYEYQHDFSILPEDGRGMPDYAVRGILELTLDRHKAQYLSDMGGGD